MKTNDPRTRILLLLALVLLAPAPLRAQQKDDGADQAQEQRDQAKEKEQERRARSRQERDQERKYQKGLKAMDQRQWEEAIETFDEVIEMGGSRVDGAWYYKGYAQNKLGDREGALESLARLLKEFPDSRWIKDGKALRVEIREASGEAVDPGEPVDEELKLIAVNSLMHTDPEKALPVLQKLLEGN